MAYASKDDLVLECGCGPGRVLTHLSKRRYRVVGIDIHRRSLVALKKRHPQAMIVVADASALPFRSGVFGCVLCFATICYLPAGPERGLEEIRRVMKQGGKLVTTMYHLNLIQLLQYARRFLPGRKAESQFLFWCVSAHEWKRILRAYGFRPIEQAYTLYKWSIARYCGFLVKRGRFSYRQQRDGDKVPLNAAGQLAWRIMSAFPRLFANHYYIANVLGDAPTNQAF